MRRAALVLVLAGLMLIAGGLGSNAYRQAIAAPGPAPLPATLAGLPRLEALAGLKASENIADLHRQQFQLTGAAVGFYMGESEAVTLWVSEAPLSLLALRMERAMDDAIASQPSPFTPLGTRQTAGREVRLLTGTGQNHYYFRTGNLVIWVAASEAVAEAALAETLSFYR